MIIDQQVFSLGRIRSTLKIMLSTDLDDVEGDWAFWMAIPGLLYIVGLTLVMIAYAWVINTIREYKENKKLKEKNRL